MVEHSDQGRSWIRRLTHLAEWVAGLGFLLHSLILAVEALHKGHWPDRLLHFRLAWPLQLALLASLATVWAVARSPRARMFLIRLVAGPPPPPAGTPLLFHGPRPYGIGEHLPGRQADGEACWALLQQGAFVVLEGESGSGKSSLLNAVLMPAAQRLFTPVRVRPGDDPCRNTLVALARLVPQPADWPATPEGVARAIEAIARARTATREPPTADRAVLLCVDQFEELFRAVDDERRRAFLATLRVGIEAGHLRVLAVIRSDFVDLLVNLCREVDPSGQAFDLGNFYILKPFRRAQALDVLRDILSPVSRANTRLERELAVFAEALVDELLQPPRDRRLSRGDEKTVLPAELQMVGTMIESLGVEHFTAHSFRRHGGRNGLLSAYLEAAKTYVSRKAAVSGDRAMLVLRQLIPRGTEGQGSRSAPRIAEALGWPVGQVIRVLEAFADRKLVNALPHDPAVPESGAGAEPRYELTHEHLGRILDEAPDPVLQKAREAEERLRFWRARTAAADEAAPAKPMAGRVIHRFFQPVPIVETLRLWTAARAPEDRGMVRRSLVAFTVKCTFVAALVAAGVAATYTDRYQMYAILRDAPSVDPVQALWVVDGWTEILWRAGYTREARAEVTRALASVASRGDTVRHSFVTTILSTIEGEALHAGGDVQGAEQRFERARTLMNAVRNDNSRDDRLGAFMMAGRLAEALGRTGRIQEAIATWRSAFRGVKQSPPTADQSHYSQFIYTARGVSELPADAHRALWMDAVEAVRSAYFPPLNCWALSELAAELYKEGDAATAEAVWDDAVRAVETFRPAPDLPPIATVSVPVPPVPQPLARTASGTIVELPFTYDPPGVSWARAHTLARIAHDMHGVGKRAEANRFWEKALAQGAAIEGAMPARSDPPVEAASLRDGPPTRRVLGPSVASPLGLYHDVAEHLYRAGESGLQSAAERAIAQLGEKRIDEPLPRATYAMASAGRLYASDRSAAARAWQHAVSAASEIRDPDDTTGDTERRPGLPEPVPVPTSNEPLRQIQAALTRTNDSRTRSTVFETAAWTMLRAVLAEREPEAKAARAAAALEMARSVTDEQRRRNLLQQAAQELLERNDGRQADAFIREARAEARATRDDTGRSSQLAWLAKVEAQHRRFREARLGCERCLSTDTLSVYARVLWEYEAGRDRVIAQALQRRGARYAR